MSFTKILWKTTQSHPKLSKGSQKIVFQLILKLLPNIWKWVNFLENAENINVKTNRALSWLYIYSQRERERERVFGNSYDRPLALPMPSDSFTTFCLLQSL